MAESYCLTGKPGIRVMVTRDQRHHARSACTPPSDSSPMTLIIGQGNDFCRAAKLSRTLTTAACSVRKVAQIDDAPRECRNTRRMPFQGGHRGRPGPVVLVVEDMLAANRERY